MQSIFCYNLHIMSSQNWNAQHAKYAHTDWINKPTLFAQFASPFFLDKGKLLDLGCGQGQDSRYFAGLGYEVTALDFSEEGIKFAKEKSAEYVIDYWVRDMGEHLPFEDNSFDVVYSHLAIHYFSKGKTEAIFRELKRVLKSGGVLALFVNSVNDPEYGTGTKIEDEFFQIGDIQKRYFSEHSLKSYVEDMEAVVLDEKGETYKDRAKSVNNLVRFIGKKK